MKHDIRLVTKFSDYERWKSFLTQARMETTFIGSGNKDLTMDMYKPLVCDENMDLYIINPSKWNAMMIVDSCKRIAPVEDDQVTPVENNIHVSLMAVRKECWGLGMGDSLMKYAIKIGEMQKCECITLLVSPNNDSAIRLYTKNGFKEEAKAVSYSGEPRLFMLKRLR